MRDYRQFYINGEWVEPSTSDTLEVINPATEEAIATIAMGGKADVDKAVAAAKAAFETFSQTSVEERSALLGRIIECYKARMGDIAANFAGSATELASLGEAFSTAVTLYGESNQALLEGLARIEDSMDRSSTQSNEQMAYYVAQAREIIDQSMLSQKEIIEEMRQLGRQEDMFPAEAS